MRQRTATVWWGRQKVGRLREDARGLLYFAYAADWLDGDSFPVSVSLPLHNGERESEAHGFFAGLLPEGGTRQRICRQSGIDSEDDTGLLLAIGGDCAGALSILPEGQKPGAPAQPPRQLREDELLAIIRAHGTNAPQLTGQPQRFSLAGAQDKLPVRLEDDRYTLPTQHYPSSHILKFETIPRVCFAEYLANRMAQTIGLPVVETQFLQSGAGDKTRPWLCITRYDRARNQSGELLRLHQEDLLQALGMPARLKYEKDGGPGLAEFAELLRAHLAEPARALANLRDWQIFNYLIGNWDGHGKNLALLYRPGESVPVLAPFYDLVAIEFLNLITPGSYARDMALAIGANMQPERITRQDWELLARQLGIPPRPLLKRLQELAERLPAIAMQCREEFARVHGDTEIHARLDDSVHRRCHWTLRSVFGRG